MPYPRYHSLACLSIWVLQHILLLDWNMQSVFVWKTSHFQYLLDTQQEPSCVLNLISTHIPDSVSCSHYEVTWVFMHTWMWWASKNIALQCTCTLTAEMPDIPHCSRLFYWMCVCAQKRNQFEEWNHLPVRQYSKNSFSRVSLLIVHKFFVSNSRWL